MGYRCGRTNKYQKLIGFPRVLAPQRYAIPPGCEVAGINIGTDETILPDADHFVNEMVLTDQGAREMAAQLLPKVWPVVQKIRGL